MALKRFASRSKRNSKLGFDGPKRSATEPLSQTDAAKPEPEVVEVDWPVGENCNWIDTSEEVRAKGIPCYHLIKIHNGFYEYELHFKNTKGWAFTFKDGAGENHRAMTVRNGAHYFRFNSPDPRIVSVS